MGSVLLTGPRRHGKSSLMYGLVDTPPPANDVILLDVEWVETPDEFLTTIAAELLALSRIRSLLTKATSLPASLLAWVSGVVEEVGVGASSVGELKIRLRQRLDVTAWPELAEQTLGLLQGLSRPVVLILDEFPIMIGNMIDRDAESALRFLRWFRAFRQSPGTERLRFLLGGSTNIEPRLEALRSEALLGDLQRLRIMPFDKEAALRFVTEVLRQEDVPFEAGVPDEIWRCSRTGVPYYLQVIVAECLAEARRHKRPIAVTDVRPLYEERVVGAMNRHRFSHYHTRLRLHYADLEASARIVLQALCAGPTATEILADHLRNQGQNPADLERLLVLLESDYYVVRDSGSVAFNDGLLCDWWIRNSLPAGARS